MKKAPLARCCVAPDATIRQAAEILNETGVGAVLVLDTAGRMIGLVTDGDLRRAVLRLEGFQHPVTVLLHDDQLGGPRGFIWAPMGASTDTLLSIMRQHGIRHVPLLDPDGRPQDIALLEELTTLAVEAVPTLDNAEAVVMAGGFGTRLRPLTDDIPKPMLPVGDRPLLEIIVGQLKQNGITKIALSTFFQADMIRDHFGDGSRFGVRISYLSEDSPLGTAGALSLLPRPNGPLLVLNGDILTQTNFAAMINFHRSHDARVTIGSHYYEVEVPYGVLDVDGVDVRGITEKPKLTFPVSGGIYVLSPEVFDHLPRGQHCNMPDLIERARQAGGRIVAFPIVEYWRDIGRVSDYLKAIKDHEQSRRQT